MLLCRVLDNIICSILDDINIMRPKSQKQMYKFRLGILLSLFLRVELIIFQHQFR